MLGSLAAWIYGLIQHNNSLKYQIAQKDASAEVKEWSDKISSLDNVISDDKRDYEKAKNDSAGAITTTQPK